MHQGVRELEEYRKKGRILSRKEAMAAYCCDCMNEYQDGRMSCKNPRCPLFPYMPYNRKGKTDITTEEK